MFDEPKTSLGDFDEYERALAFKFLKGEAWEEQFEFLEADVGNTPPDWLVKWSNSWEAESVMTIDDVDPLIGEYVLVIDRSSNEVWAGIHQGDDQVVFERLSVDIPTPDLTAVCDFFLKELEEVGSYPFSGNLTISAAHWLPRDRVEAFLKKQMKKLGAKKIGKLTLEQWLDREYASP